MIAILVISLSGSGAGASPTPAGQTTTVARATAAPDSCLDAQNAIRYYRARTNAARLSVPDRVRSIPDRIKWPTCYLARRAAREWQLRYRAALGYAARRYAYHYTWTDWLPFNWRRLGACETGYGRIPGSWSWDSGRFVSAFGIYRAGYADDAHRIGHLSWDETKRILHRLPTPREQYEAALSHYATNGDGWGCPGP